MTAVKAMAVCPACGCFGPPELFLGEAARREAVRAALALPAPLAQQIMGYVGMWRPLQRGHSWDRVERLLSEILALLTPGTVTHDGVTTPAPVDVWQAALDELLVERRPTLDLPLTSHGYLVSMVAGRARKDAARVRSDAEALARGETPIGWSQAHASPAAQPTASAGAERLRDLNGDLATLRRLAKFNPTVHDADIARIESQIAALSGRSTQ